MKRLKAFLWGRLGLAGLITLAQVLLFSTLVVGVHALFFRGSPSLLPIVLAGGLISLQPSYLKSKTTVRMLILMFAFGCSLSFLLTAVFPRTVPFYLLSLLLGVVILSVLRVRPFPVVAFIPMNLAYWMDLNGASPAAFSLLLFAEISVGALLALGIDRVVKVSAYKNLRALYRRYAVLLQAKQEKYAAAGQTPTTNTMLEVLGQIDLLQREYIKETDLPRGEAARLDTLFEAATQLFFTIQVMRASPVEGQSAAVYRKQFGAFTGALQAWEGAA